MHTRMIQRPEDLVYETINNNYTKHPTTATLGNYDVICGRHKAAFDNIGNRRFRVLVTLSYEKYANASSRAHKSAVIKNIVDTVHAGGGRFLQRLGCSWVELDEKQRHDKVGHALRDMAVAAKSKSPSKRVSSYSIDTSDQSHSSKKTLTREESGTSFYDTTKTSLIENIKNAQDDDKFTIEVSDTSQEKLKDEFDFNMSYFNFDVDDTTLEPIAWTPTQQTNNQFKDL